MITYITLISMYTILLWFISKRSQQRELQRASSSSFHLWFTTRNERLKGFTSWGEGAKAGNHLVLLLAFHHLSSRPRSRPECLHPPSPAPANVSVSNATTITSWGIILFRPPHTRDLLVGWLAKNKGMSAEVPRLASHDFCPRLTPNTYALILLAADMLFTS